MQSTCLDQSCTIDKRTPSNLHTFTMYKITFKRLTWFTHLAADSVVANTSTADGVAPVCKAIVLHAREHFRSMDVCLVTGSGADEFLGSQAATQSTPSILHSKNNTHAHKQTTSKYANAMRQRTFVFSTMLLLH